MKTCAFAYRLVFTIWVAACFLAAAAAIAPHASAQLSSCTCGTNTECCENATLARIDGNWKAPDEPERYAQKRNALKNLLNSIGGKLATKMGKLFDVSYGFPYNPVFDKALTFGEDWYTFGLTAGAGYQALAQASALKGKFQANAFADAKINAILFSKSFPVLEGFMGAGNNLQVVKPGTGLQLNPSLKSWKQWLPQVTANVKLFGITIWEKKMPNSDLSKCTPDDGTRPTAASDGNSETLAKCQKAWDLENQFTSNAAAAVKQTSSQVQNQFNQYAQAVQTSIGQGTNPNVQGGQSPTSAPNTAAGLEKQLLDFKKGVKEMFGAAIIIPIVPPLNIEIDFGVFFSHSLMFELGISGYGINLNASTDLSKDESGSGFLGQLKNEFTGNETVSGIGSLLSGNFDGNLLGLLNMADDGEEVLDAIRNKVAAVLPAGVTSLPSSEIKASLSIMPSATAGAWVKAAAVLDIVVASASAGVKGTLKLAEAKVGGRLSFASAADYIDLDAVGTLTLLSGTLELFAGVHFIANVIQPIEWSKVIAQWPGKTYDFKAPLARLAYRDEDNNFDPRLIFPCSTIDSNLKIKPITKMYKGVDECNFAVRVVPSQNSDYIVSDMKAVVAATGTEPLDAQKPCTILINSSAILATFNVDAATCGNYVTGSGGTANAAMRAQLLDRARNQFPEKFVSNLYDDAGNPAVLLEAYHTSSGANPVQQSYETEGVDKYSPEPWSKIVASVRPGNNNPQTDPNNYVPGPQGTDNEEPTVKVRGFATPVAVRYVGQEGNNDLYSDSVDYLTGFCRINPDSPGKYCVKAYGVAYPNGCVPMASMQSLRQFARQFDCVPKTSDDPTNIDGAAKKVAACLLRDAFDRGLCYPPKKAYYITKVMDILNSVTDEQLFNQLKAGDFRASNLASRCELWAPLSGVGCSPTQTTLKNTNFNFAALKGWLAARNQQKATALQGYYDSGYLKCNINGMLQIEIPPPAECLEAGYRVIPLEQFLDSLWIETAYATETGTGSGGSGPVDSGCGDSTSTYQPMPVSACSPVYIKKVKQSFQTWEGWYTSALDWNTSKLSGFNESDGIEALITSDALAGLATVNPVDGLSWPEYGVADTIAKTCDFTLSKGWFTSSPQNVSMAGYMGGMGGSGSVGGWSSGQRGLRWLIIPGNGGFCEYPLPGTLPTQNRPSDLVQVKPQTCELLATVGSQAPQLIDQYTQGNISTRGECKDAFASNLDQLCKNSKSKVTLPSSGGNFTLSSRYQSDQVENLGTCTVDATGATSAQESGPSVAAASDTARASADSCEMLVGDDSVNKLAVAKVFQGINSEGATSATCKDLIMGTSTTGSLNACAQIDPVVARALRASNLSNLGAAKVYVRLNTRNSSSGVVLGSLLQITTCDLTSPPAQATCKVDPATNKTIKDAKGNCIETSCELLATSSKGYKIKIARANQTTQTGCVEAFKPYPVLCEQLPTLPEIRKENTASGNTAFTNGSTVPLSMRFQGWDSVNSAPLAAVEQTVASCQYNVIDTTKGKCELLVATPATAPYNGFTFNMNGQDQAQGTTIWKTTDLSSRAAATQQACKERFLTGAAAIGSGTATAKLDRTCYGLSRQIVKSTALTQPGLKGTPLTVTIKSRFTPTPIATSTPVIETLGTCSYDNNGNSTLLPAGALAGTTIPTSTAVDTSFLSGPVAPEITQLRFDTAIPDQFFLKVRYAGPLPPLAPYTQFMLEFPGQWPLAESTTLQGTLGKTGATSPAGSTLTSTTTSATTAASTLGKTGATSATTTTSAVSTSTLGKTSATSVTGSAATGSTASIPTRGPYSLPQPGQILDLGPFPLSLMGGALCMNQFRAHIITKMLPPSQTSITSAGSGGAKTMAPAAKLIPTASAVKWPAVEKTFRQILNLPCPPARIEIADVTVVPSPTGTATLSVDYKNVGGTPSSGQTFAMTIKKKPAFLNDPVPTPVVQTFAVPAVGGKSAATGFNAHTFTGACGAKVTKVSATIEITTSLSATGYKFTKLVEYTCPVIPPQIAIADARLIAPTTAGAKPTIVVDYRNSGGAVLTTSPAGSKTFTFTLKNTAVTPNKTATTAAISVPAPSTTTSPSPAVDFFTLAPACTAGVAKVSAKLSVTAATTAPTVAPAAFTKTVEYTCPVIPPQIAIADARLIAPTTAGAKPTIVVDYRNSGGAVLTTSPAGSKTFTFTLKNTAVTPNKTATTAAISVPAPSTTTSPSPAVDFFTLAPACTAGVAKVSAKLSVTAATTAPTVAPAAFTKTVEYTCPPTTPIITVSSVTVDTTAGAIKVTYQNVGAAPSANQTFVLTVKNKTNNKTTAMTLPVPAVNATPIPQASSNTVGALRFACGTATNLEVTTSLSAAGYSKTASVTIPQNSYWCLNATGNCMTKVDSEIIRRVTATSPADCSQKFFVTAANALCTSFYSQYFHTGTNVLAQYYTSSQGTTVNMNSVSCTK